VTALAVRLKLHALQRKHGTAPDPCHVPLTRPFARPQAVEGLAASTSLDLDRMQLMPYCFGTLKKSIPLWFKHDPAVVAGEIEDLHYDAGGQLHVRAMVVHELARRCGAFSVGFQLTDGIASNRGIARALNARGVPTARGGKWTAVQVGAILQRAEAATPTQLRSTPG
jgi:hypothetical protein